MKSIDVEDLPEPIAQTVQLMVQRLREQLRRPAASRPKVQLPEWPGRVLGNLSREEIYDDVI